MQQGFFFLMKIVQQFGRPFFSFGGNLVGLFIKTNKGKGLDEVQAKFKEMDSFYLWNYVCIL